MQFQIWFRSDETTRSRTVSLIHNLGIFEDFGLKLCTMPETICSCAGPNQLYIGSDNGIRVSQTVSIKFQNHHFDQLVLILLLLAEILFPYININSSVNIAKIHRFIL